ncbi:MAG: type II toxin-antitoxin system RelE/ParE family toxin [Thaumarchaeota archaeon]|nr:type II toxin-antitoxin system RelE/ParE family toxin [Nitrososphaerota archaeon]
MPYEVVLTGRASKSFRNLPQEVRQQVSVVLGILSQIPVLFVSFDVKKLKGLKDTYRIRRGDWRIIYAYQSQTKIIVVQDILRREKAYQ